jgi:hypothetical protein
VLSPLLLRSGFFLVVELHLTPFGVTLQQLIETETSMKDLFAESLSMGFAQKVFSQQLWEIKGSATQSQNREP